MFDEGGCVGGGDAGGGMAKLNVCVYVRACLRRARACGGWVEADHIVAPIKR